MGRQAYVIADTCTNHTLEDQTDVVALHSAAFKYKAEPDGGFSLTWSPSSINKPGFETVHQCDNEHGKHNSRVEAFRDWFEQNYVSAAQYERTYIKHLEEVARQEEEAAKTAEEERKRFAELEDDADREAREEWEAEQAAKTGPTGEKVIPPDPEGGDDDQEEDDQEEEEDGEEDDEPIDEEIVWPEGYKPSPTPPTKKSNLGEYNAMKTWWDALSLADRRRLGVAGPWPTTKMKDSWGKVWHESEDYAYYMGWVQPVSADA